MRGIRLAGCVIVSLFVTCGGVAEGSDPATAALKDIAKAAEGVRGIAAEVEYLEVVEHRSIRGSGKLYFDYEGPLRVEIGGDEPRTVILLPPHLYVHRHAKRVVELYDVTANAHLLAQYIKLGFAPTGTALKENFDVELVENSELDGKPVLSFRLIPKPKKAKAIAEAIGGIQLWVDPQSGLPAQQEIIHAQGHARLIVRYLDVAREDELPDSLFQLEWPDGVETVRK